MNEKEAREIIKHPGIYCDKPDPLSHHQKFSIAKGYLDAVEKAKTYLWMALMDIAVDTEHECKCQCANHRIERAQEALDRWGEEK